MKEGRFFTQYRNIYSSNYDRKLLTTSPERAHYPDRTPFGDISTRMQWTEF